MECHHKFPKNIYEVLILMRSQEESLPISQDEESELGAEVEEPASKSLKNAFKTAFEDSFFDLPFGGTPLLQKIFGERITKHQLNAMLLEIFSAMGDRNNSIYFCCIMLLVEMMNAIEMIQCDGLDIIWGSVLMGLLHLLVKV